MRELTEFQRKITALLPNLELSLEETQDLIGRAGYSLSHASTFDRIIEYYIINGNYDLYEINEALFYFDQSLLGC